MISFFLIRRYLGVQNLFVERCVFLSGPNNHTVLTMHLSKTGYFFYFYSNSFHYSYYLSIFLPMVSVSFFLPSFRVLCFFVIFFNQHKKMCKTEHIINVLLCRQLAESSDVYTMRIFALKNCLLSFLLVLWCFFYYLKTNIYKHTFTCVLWCRSILFIGAAVAVAYFDYC